MKTQILRLAGTRLGLRIDTVTTQRVVFYFGSFAVRFEFFFNLPAKYWFEHNLFLTL